MKSAKVETITPKKASEYITRNISNRPRRERRIDKYAGAMTAGVWDVNGETIKFNCNGDLVDGQHRLYACIKSGKSFDTYVVHGIEQKAFDTIDQGDPRTISDVFARHGYKNYAMLAGAARWVWAYELSSSGTRYNYAMRQDEANDVLEKHPALQAAAARARELQSSKLIPPSTLAFLLYWTGKNSPHFSDKFWASVMESEGLEKGKPAHILNKRLQANLGAVARLDPTTLAALAIKAWNAHTKGKFLKTLKWTREEAFPEILL